MTEMGEMVCCCCCSSRLGDLVFMARSASLITTACDDQISCAGECPEVLTGTHVFFHIDTLLLDQAAGVMFDAHSLCT